MSQIRSEFHSTIALGFIDSIYYQRSNFFYFLGKINPWTNDASVPSSPDKTVANDVEIRDNIIYIRQISPNEITLVTQNYTWESGVVYDQWDHTIIMEGKPFYCVNSDYNVYKCLNNNNGAASTEEPTGQSLIQFTTSDGYMWKYMYNIPSFKRRKFLSSQFLPVQKALSDGFYSRGAVEQVSVISGGTGYTSSPQVTITITGDGSGAVLVPIISNVDGSIIDVRIEDGGTGYTIASLDIVSVSGSGAYGNPTAIVTAIMYNGSIVNVTIEDPGQYYPADVTTSILVQGDGSGAAFTPVVSAGSIIDVVVDNPGSGYSYIDLIVQGTGSGAELQAVLAASDFLSDQALVEQSAVDGAIYSIVVTNPGNNYTTNSTVTIEGDGTGCTAEIVLNGSTIEKINVLTNGSGYTYANVIIGDPNRNLPNDYIDAEAYAILPPIGGHGYNAVKELYSNSMCIFTQLKDDSELILLNQDFRQYGILVNPTILSTYQRATEDIYFITFKVTLNNILDIVVDDIIICNDTYYRVAVISGLQVELQQLCRLYKNVSVGDSFYKPTTPEIQYVVSSVDQSPEVDKYSGSLVYTTNAEPFILTNEQLVSIRTYITF